MAPTSPSAFGAGWPVDAYALVGREDIAATLAASQLDSSFQDSSSAASASTGIRGCSTKFAASTPQDLVQLAGPHFTTPAGGLFTPAFPQLHLNWGHGGLQMAAADGMAGHGAAVAAGAKPAVAPGSAHSTAPGSGMLGLGRAGPSAVHEQHPSSLPHPQPHGVTPVQGMHGGAGLFAYRPVGSGLPFWSPAAHHLVTPSSILHAQHLLHGPGGAAPGAATEGLGGQAGDAAVPGAASYSGSSKAVQLLEGNKDKMMSDDWCALPTRAA